MRSDLEFHDTAAIDLAREAIYRFLAAALRHPSVGRAMLLDSTCQQVACAAADLLRTETGAASTPLGFGELPPELLTLRPLCAGLNESAGELAGEFVRVFGLVPTPECQPHETEFQHTTEPFFRAQQLADVAGFYQAFGLEPAHEYPERPDHLALELEFMAFLLLKQRLAHAAGCQDHLAAERARVCAEAARSFLRDHLAWWVPSFARGLQRKAGSGPYAALGQALAAFLPLERARFGVAAPRLPLEPALSEPPEEQADCATCAGPA